MKILIVNQSDNSGGAAVAAMRMALAMQGAGAEVRMLVHMQNTSHDFVSTPYKSAFYKHHAFFNFALERFHFLFHEKNKDVRFAFSSAITGHDITSHPYFVWADVVHLHWTNFGLLSLGNLSKVFESGKKVVWTMHDIRYMRRLSVLEASCKTRFVGTPAATQNPHHCWQKGRLCYT